MIVIRPEQVEALRRVVMAPFEAWMAEHLPALHPALAAMDAAARRDFLADGIARASRYGISLLDHVRIFLECLSRYGPSFGATPRTAWVDRILSGAGPEGERIALLARTASRMVGARGGASDSGADRLVLQAGRATIELVRIPAGSAIIGSPAEPGRLPNEGQARTLAISAPFYMAAVPLTIGQAGALRGEEEREADVDALPARMSLRAAQATIELLSRALAVSVLLPTSAQWEYACRAGTTSRFWSGDSEEELHRVGWYAGNCDGSAQPVGRKPANPWGLHDMHGNVAEHCADAIGDPASLADVDPVGEVEERFSDLRGGAAVPAAGCRSAARIRSVPTFIAGLRPIIPPEAFEAWQ